MIGWGIVGLVVLSSLFILRVKAPKEWRAVQTTMISAPPDVVFDLASAVERMPQWYGHPSWVPWLLRVSRLSLWNEHLNRKLLLEAPSQNKGEIQIRSHRVAEFSYLQYSPSRVVFESKFRIAARARGCQLTWEIRYQLPRMADRMAHRLSSRSQVFDGMEDSLRMIRNMAEHIVMRPAWQKLLETAPQPAGSWSPLKSKAS